MGKYRVDEEEEDLFTVPSKDEEDISKRSRPGSPGFMQADDRSLGNVSDSEDGVQKNNIVNVNSIRHDLLKDQKVEVLLSNDKSVDVIHSNKFAPLHDEDGFEMVLTPNQRRKYKRKKNNAAATSNLRTEPLNLRSRGKNGKQ